MKERIYCLFFMLCVLTCCKAQMLAPLAERLRLKKVAAMNADFKYYSYCYEAALDNDGEYNSSDPISVEPLNKELLYYTAEFHTSMISNKISEDIRTFTISHCDKDTQSREEIVKASFKKAPGCKGNIYVSKETRDTIMVEIINNDYALVLNKSKEVIMLKCFASNKVYLLYSEMMASSPERKLLLMALGIESVVNFESNFNKVVKFAQYLKGESVEFKYNGEPIPELEKEKDEIDDAIKNAAPKFGVG